MMVNQTQGKVLAQRCTAVTSALGHALGLMFSAPRALVLCFRFPAKRGIHTGFVLFPLTALFLDGQRQIVEIAHLKPFSVYISKKKAQYVVELPGKVRSCRVGDRVRFKC